MTVRVKPVHDIAVMLNGFGTKLVDDLDLLRRLARGQCAVVGRTHACDLAGLVGV